jgi:hypothetical protein
MPEQPGEDPLMANIDQDLTTLDEKVFNLRAVLRRQREDIARLTVEKGLLETRCQDLDAKRAEAEARANACLTQLAWKERQLQVFLHSRRWALPICNLIGHRWATDGTQRVCLICKTSEPLAIAHEPDIDSPPGNNRTAT